MTTKKIEEIKTHPTFESLFPINSDLLKKIEQNMRDENYDDSQPIILGTWTGQDEPVCIDGHTRLKAAANAGIEEVFVCSYEFDTEESAFEYALNLQSNRRNLTDGDLIHCIERLHERMPRGGARKSGHARESTPQSCGTKNGRSAGAKRTADLLNISTRKAEQALTIIKHGSPEDKEAILKKEMSINRAYQKTQAARKKAEAESSAEVSHGQATGESQEGEEGDDSQVSKFCAAVFISMEHLGALQELGGSVEDHLAIAVERYLGSLREQDEGNSTVTAQDDVEDEDDDEYFYPNGYNREVHDADERQQNEENRDESEDEDDDEEYF